jgi:hypothetical protein
MSDEPRDRCASACGAERVVRGTARTCERGSILLALTHSVRIVETTAPLCAQAHRLALVDRAPLAVAWNIVVTCTRTSRRHGVSALESEHVHAASRGPLCASSCIYAFDRIRMMQLLHVHACHGSASHHNPSLGSATNIVPLVAHRERLHYRWHLQKQRGGQRNQMQPTTTPSRCRAAY